MDPTDNDLSPPASVITGTSGGPPSSARGSALPSPSRSMEAAAGISKTLVVAVESLKVEGDEVLDFKGRLPPSASMDIEDKIRVSCSSAATADDNPVECDFEEDIIDGFAIASFKTLKDVEEYVTSTAAGQCLLPKCMPSTSKSTFIDDCSQNSSTNSVKGAQSEKLWSVQKRAAIYDDQATDDETTADIQSTHSPSSHTTSIMDIATLDERPPSLLSPDDDIEATVIMPTSRSNSPKVLNNEFSSAVGMKCVTTSLPRERHNASASVTSVPSPLSTSIAESSDVKNLEACGSSSSAQLINKKCMCDSSVTGSSAVPCSVNCKLSVAPKSFPDDHKIATSASEYKRAITESPLAISIKIEDTTPPPPSLTQQDALDYKKSSFTHGHMDIDSFAQNRDKCQANQDLYCHEKLDDKASVHLSRDLDNRGRMHAAGSSSSSNSSNAKSAVKAHRRSPGSDCGHLDGSVRTVSRSPSIHRSQSHSRSSRHSVEIKSEQGTPPPVLKKSSGHRSSTSTSGKHTPCSSNSNSHAQPPSASSSFPLYTPSVVPASSFLPLSTNAAPFRQGSFDGIGLSYPFRGLNTGSSLFAPPAPPSIGLNPSLLQPQLMMGLHNQFGPEAILAANEMARLQQELNSRFLHDRGMLGLPPVPFTLHTEMHQHQHLHHHQHVVTPGFLPPANTAGLFSAPISMTLSGGNDLLLHSKNLSELAERERLAKQMANLSSLSGLNVPQSLHTGLPFSQGLHHSGAFQPKVPTATGAVPSLNPASQLLLSLRDHENNLARNSSLTKRRGRWCSAHVQVAWKIHHHKNSKLLNPAERSTTSEAASLQASLGAAADITSLRAGLNSADVTASFRTAAAAAEAASLRAQVEAASLCAGLRDADADALKNGLNVSTDMASLRAGLNAASLRAAEAASRASLNSADITALRAGLGTTKAPSFSAGLAAADVASLRAQLNVAQALNNPLFGAGLLGGLGGAGDLRPGLLGQGLETVNAGMFGQQIAASSGTNLMAAPRANPVLSSSSSSLHRHPSPQTSRSKPDPGHRDGRDHHRDSSLGRDHHRDGRDHHSSDRHHMSSSAQQLQHHQSVLDSRSEQMSNRARDHHSLSSSAGSSHQLPHRTRTPIDHHHHRSHSRRERSRSRSPLSSSHQNHHVSLRESEMQQQHYKRNNSASLLTGQRPTSFGSFANEVSAPSSSSSALSDPLAARNSRMSSVAPSGHAFSSLPHSLPKPGVPVNASLPPGAPLSSLDRDAVSVAAAAQQLALHQQQQQQQERDRLHLGAAGVPVPPPGFGLQSLLPGGQMLPPNCDPATALLLRDRLMMTEQRDRMLLAVAAAEYESRSLRPGDHPGLRPGDPMAQLSGLYQSAPGPAAGRSHGVPDGLLGGATGSMMLAAAAAQSALLRPSLNPQLAGQPGLKMPLPYGPLLDGSMMDASAVNNLANSAAAAAAAAAHLNLPFR